MKQGRTGYVQTLGNIYADRAVKAAATNPSLTIQKRRTGWALNVKETDMSPLGLKKEGRHVLPAPTPGFLPRGNITRQGRPTLATPTQRRYKDSGPLGPS